MLPHLLDVFAVAAEHSFEIDIVFLRNLREPLHGGLRGDLLTDLLGQRIIHAHDGPFAAEIVFRAVGQGDLERTGGIAGGILDERLGEIRDRMIIAICLIGLEHREFRGMRGIRALIAEIAVDLEHVVEAADHRPLEEQLRGDPQEQLHVVGVHVGGERPGGGAAVEGLEHGRLDLHEAGLREGAAQGDHDVGAELDRLARGVAGDEVDVALAHPGLVGELGVERGQRTQGLGRELPFRSHDGELAALGLDDPAAEEHVVAEVDVGLPGVEPLLADLLLRQHALEAGAVPGLQGDEAELAGVAEEHDAAGDGDDVLGLLPVLERGVGLAHLGQGVGAGHVDRVGLLPLLEQPDALVLADPQLFGVEVVRGVGRGSTGLGGIEFWHGSKATACGAPGRNPRFPRRPPAPAGIRGSRGTRRPGRPRTAPAARPESELLSSRGAR